MAVESFIHTSNLTSEQELSWTIDNFSRTPRVLKSPPFYAYPGSSEEFCLQFEFQGNTNRPWYFTVYLINMSNKNIVFNLSYSLTLKTTVDGINIEYTRGKYFFNNDQDNKHELLTYYGNFDNLDNRHFSAIFLSNDRLIVQATLTFSGYDVKSRISSDFPDEPSNDREDLVKDFRTMYESGFAWDIAFSINNQTLHAHKAVICSRSPVFAKMFNLEMKEKNSNIVYIQDANVHVFNCFLLYLYTSIVEFEKWDTVLDLYSLASKYEVDSLRKKCSEILRRNLTVDSVCSVLALADLHDDKDLKEAGKKFLKGNVLQVVVTSQWAELIITKPELVKEVMESVK